MSCVNQLGCDPISQNLPACLRALPTGKIMGHILDEWSDEQKQAVLQGTLSSRGVGVGGDFVPALYPVCSRLSVDCLTFFD